MKKLTILLCAILLALVACSGGSGSQDEVIPTNTLAPLFSLTPRLTATPLSTRTPIPTFTPIPSETPIPPTPSDTPSPTPRPPVIGIVQSLQDVNIREGPGTTFNAFRALVPGTGVEVLGQNPEGNWYNIRMDDGEEGWIASSLLFLESTPTPIPTFTLTPNLTALALGTPLPTALLGGGTVTPTPPRAVTTATPGTLVAQLPEITEESGPTESFLPVIGGDAISETATALAAGVIPLISPPAPAATGQSPNSIPTSTATPDANSISVITLTPTTQGGAPGIPTIQTTPESNTTAAAPTAPPAGNASTQQGVDVFAMCNNTALGSPAPTNLGAGSTIDVFWAWYVRDADLVDQHVEAVNYEVRVNGTLLSNWRQYGTSVVQVGDQFAKYWYVPFGPLQAGDYTITYRATWSETITDGWDNFGPGTRNVQEEGACNFTVR
ncbi:MAG: hypothetical protein OHK0046_43770 [Anaerolineae bacterium]